MISEERGRYRKYPGKEKNESPRALTFFLHIQVFSPYLFVPPPIFLEFLSYSAFPRAFMMFSRLFGFSWLKIPAIIIIKQDHLPSGPGPLGPPMPLGLAAWPERRN